MSTRGAKVRPALATVGSRVESLRQIDSRPIWIFAALVAATGAGGVFDGFDPNKAALLPLVVAPVAAALVLPVRATAVISGLCVFLALVLPQAFLTSSGPQLVRFSSLVALSLLAVISTVWRQRLGDARVRLAVAAAQASDARRRAVELNDGVYQNLFAARMWSEVGDGAASTASIDKALAATYQLLAEMLEQAQIEPGSLVQRGAPAPGVIDLRPSADED